MTYKTQTKQKIYDAAKELFYTEGYSVGTRKIAEKAGVKQGVIAYHFNGKKEIAIQVLKEDYAVLSSYIRYRVDMYHDIFLFMCTFWKMTDQTMQNDPSLLKFIYEVTQDNILEESYHAGNQTMEYKRLVETYLKNENTLEKNLEIFLSISCSTFNSYISKIYQKNIFSFEELFYWQVKIANFALGSPFNEKSLVEIRKKSDEIVKTILNDHPYLVNAKDYFMKLGTSVTKK